MTAKSLYPKAEFSYIGHSNGTYLVAKALQDCEAVKFDNIVFAGSVVVTNFEWSKLIPGQVTRVLNYVATDDRIVAVFPYIFERTRIQDLGGAGHRGFKDPAERKEDPAVRNFRRVVGGHGAALAEDRWEEMAKFVLKGSWPKIPEDEVALSNEARRAEKLAPLYWLLIVVGVLGIAGLILGIAGSPGWIAAIALVGYVYAVHAALTRA